jgi:hypothetical protein
MKKYKIQASKSSSKYIVFIKILTADDRKTTVGRYPYW